MSIVTNLIRVFYFFIWSISGIYVVYFSYMGYYSLAITSSFIFGFGFSKMYDLVWSKE
jgi:hypothetical protein